MELKRLCGIAHAQGLEDVRCQLRLPPKGTPVDPDDPDELLWRPLLNSECSLTLLPKATQGAHGVPASRPLLVVPNELAPVLDGMMQRHSAGDFLHVSEDGLAEMRVRLLASVDALIATPQHAQKLCAWHQDFDQHRRRWACPAFAADVSAGIASIVEAKVGVSSEVGARPASETSVTTLPRWRADRDFITALYCLGRRKDTLGPHGFSQIDLNINRQCKM